MGSTAKRLYDAVTVSGKDGYGNFSNSEVQQDFLIRDHGLSLGLIKPWEIHFSFRADRVGELAIRNIQQGDERHLEQFGRGLGSLSRELFSPYPWGDGRAANEAFRKAIERSITGTDAAYLMFHQGLPIAHFVLWGVSKRQEYMHFSLAVPTLGIGIIDSLHNKGIGRLCIRFLQLIARVIKANAIELTTATQNLAAAHLYHGCLFQEIGRLTIPLGVDPSTPLDECADVNIWREERHMVHILSERYSYIIRRYLLSKESEHMRYGSCLSKG